MRKLLATLLTSLLLIQTAPLVAAKPKGDWNTVKALASHSIAVKTTRGETHYGLLQSVDDTSMLVQIAGKEDFSGQEVSFRRDEVAKVWRAKLRFGDRNIAKAAWIGAGAGFATTVITLTATRNTENADANVGAVWFPFIGAGVGAIAGAFWKKKHKKQDLVYSV